MNTCKKCGAEVKSGFVYCYSCKKEGDLALLREVLSMDLTPDNLWSDGSPMCVMCGVEWGTSSRDDGKYYCSMCWTVWKS